jgi:aspartyl-tRNA(Asn)/glutamyl-tRNA(Gln) amidotransferase subunit A
MKRLHELSIAEAGRVLRAGAISSTALTPHALARIVTLDPLLRAFGSNLSQGIRLCALG